MTSAERKLRYLSPITFKTLLPKNPSRITLRGHREPSKISRRIFGGKADVQVMCKEPFPFSSTWKRKQSQWLQPTWTPRKEDKPWGAGIQPFLVLGPENGQTTFVPPNKSKECFSGNRMWGRGNQWSVQSISTAVIEKNIKVKS